MTLQVLSKNYLDVLMETFQHFCATVSRLSCYLLFKFEQNTFIVSSRKIDNIVIIF